MKIQGNNIVTVVFLVLLFVCGHASAQMDSRDFTDVIKTWKKDTSASRSSELQIGKTYISFLPVVGYAPANGFLIGGVVSLTQLVAEPPTNASSGMLNMQITTKNQFIINARSKVYLANNEWFLQGDWRLLFFTQPTYGLGVNNSGGNKYLVSVNNLGETDLPGAEDMKFNYVRVYEDVVRRIKDSHWYAGLGIAFDWHSSIVDQKLNTDTASPDFYITNHYAYSLQREFNPHEYFTSGFNLNVLTDTRDNVANTYKGYYGSVSFRFNPEFSKSSQESTMMLYDLRYYLGLSKAHPRKVLAFWSSGTFVMDGNVPYLALPSIGWDTYNRSGRGYIQGRYRGLNFIYAETEYRFPISKNGLWGGALFANNTFAQASGESLFEHAAPAFGGGIRLKMDKAARINLTVDVGYGLDNSSGIYFSMQEAF